jgi:hypothetical protein
MNSLRPPGNSPCCVNGTVPAKISTGTRPRMALLTALPRFCVPASTWTITACGSPVTMAYACAADRATVSCGQTMSFGSVSAQPSARACAIASSSAG